MIKVLFLAVLGYLAWKMLSGRKTRTPAMSPREARDVLGVSTGAELDEVQAAYRRLVARVHPDTGGTPELARRVKTARDVLVRDLDRMPPATL